MKSKDNRIFAINLGSTSTKVAYYINNTCIQKDTISHSLESLKAFDTVFEQMDMRKSQILKYLRKYDIDLVTLDAFVSRGGQTEPIPSGVYEINEAMLKQVESGDYGVHVCSVGCRIAYDLTRGVNARALTVDTPSTDEFEALARYSGLKEIPRISCFQALNQKAMAKFYAQSIGQEYHNLNLIVVMLGGGISVVAHKKGKMVDGPDALEGDGPFSNNRCGTLPVGQLVKLCYQGVFDLHGMMKHINGEAGLLSYLGTTDIKGIEKRISEGDGYAEEVLTAMCYQVAKDIGGYATVLKGDIDAILLIGGMANSEYITEQIIERVRFIAPVVVLPGEREMESLCLRAYDALRGTEEVRIFAPNKSYKEKSRRFFQAQELSKITARP